MITPFEIPCVILSGGKSSRMGEDKSLLPFSTSKTLIEYQYNRLKPYFKDVYISSKIDKFDFLEKEFLILDENKDVFSPILALNTIFNKFPNQKVFIITVDTPFVSIETITELINQSLDVDICIGETQEKTHNLCGVFSSNINSFIKDNYVFISQKRTYIFPSLEAICFFLIIKSEKVILSSKTAIKSEPSINITTLSFA